MATKDTDTSKEKADKDVIEQQPQPESQTAQTIVQPTVVEPTKAKKNQNVITVAIISGFVLFFVGLGLGYLLGHSSVESSRNIRGTRFEFPGDEGGRRFYPNSGTNNSTNGGSSSSTTTPQTQTN